MSLQGKRVVVGLGGGIAAFKSVQLVRELMRRGAEVRVVMTEAGTRFIGPITFAGLTGRPPVTDLWAEDYAGEVHVELGEWADAIVVAPATMNLMARAATGQANVRTLAERGAVFIGPVTGALANGEIGEGRMVEPGEIADAVEAHLGHGSDLAGSRILITAGPTHEDLDPVRFLGNRSTGRMGYAIAHKALRRGAEVTLVTGPVHLPSPVGAEVIEVRSAEEMHRAVMSRFDAYDVVIMAAAVADYRPDTRAPQKIKKGKSLKLELVRNPDILADIGSQRAGRPSVLVGFALETEDLEQAAREKLEQKSADLIVANEAAAGLGGDTNQVTLVDAGSATQLPEMSKHALADQILDRVRALLSIQSRRSRPEADRGSPN
jgi:phosphopantothenoylcysteine decarboxylase/phosphopantothenate--cysteine ligase